MAGRRSSAADHGALERAIAVDIAARLEAGELVTERVLEEVIRDWAARLQRCEERLGRVTAANDRFMRQLTAARARIRHLQEENQRLHAEMDARRQRPT